MTSSAAVVLQELQLTLHFVSSVLAVVKLWETIPNAKPVLMSGTMATTGPSGKRCQDSYYYYKFLAML